MQKTVVAVFADGVLKPVDPIDWLAENRRVTVTVTVPDRPGPLDGWVGGLSDEDAQQMLRTIDGEFERVNADDWQ